MSEAKRNVLLVAMNYPPEFTGISVYSGGLAEELVQGLFEVTVITTHPHYPQWEFQEAVHKRQVLEMRNGVQIWRMRHYLPRPPKGLKRLASELSFGFAAALKQWNRPDVIVLISPALFASCLAMIKAKIKHPKVPVVVWVQDIYTRGLSETGNKSKTAKFLARKAEGWLLRKASKVVVIHERFLVTVKNEFSITQDKLVTIRNWARDSQSPGVDSKVDFRSKFGWSTEQKVVLHTGNMGVKQGLENVVKAAKIAAEQDSSIVFVLLGDGSEKQKLINIASGIENIVFMDPLDNGDYNKMLACADFLLVNELPSVTEMALPSKLTSYFAAGIPVIAATELESVTASEVRIAGAGVVIEPGRPDLLVNAIKQLSNHPEELKVLGEAGRDYVKNSLSKATAFAAFRSIFDEL